MFWVLGFELGFTFSFYVVVWLFVVARRIEFGVLQWLRWILVSLFCVVYMGCGSLSGLLGVGVFWLAWVFVFVAFGLGFGFGVTLDLFVVVLWFRVLSLVSDLEFAFVVYDLVF